MTKRILVIEASTSAAKAMLFSLSGRILRIQEKSYSQEIGNVARQDVNGIFKSVIDCVKQVIAGDEDQIEGIALVSVWHSLLLLDKDRKPAHKLQTWADNSAAEDVGQFRSEKGNTQWYYEKTGCMPNSTYPFFRLMYQKKIEGLKKKFPYFISSLPEYLFEQLTGSITCSMNSASGSGLLNIRDLQWDKELLEMIGIDDRLMGSLRRLYHTESLNKDMANLMGLPSGIPVCIAGSDGGMNQVGEGFLYKEGMTISVGTSGAMRVSSSKPILSIEAATWCYYIEDKRWLSGAAIAGAGNCVQWFRNMFFPAGTQFEVLENMLENCNFHNAPLFLPFLYGERSPGWNDLRQGGFNQLRSFHTLGDLCYSVFEGILFNLKQNLETFRNMKLLPKEVVISGGIINSKTWLQMAADILNIELRVSEFEHASMVGGALWLQKLLSEDSQIKESSPVERQILQPQTENKEVFQERYEKYLHLYNLTG